MNPKNVLIGVFQQPAQSLAKWFGRGVNTLFDVAEGHDRAATLNAASALGMKAMVSPAPTNPGSEVSHPAFLGWVMPDEPENWPHVPKDALGNRDFPKAVVDYVKKYTALKAIAPNVSVFGNFNGSAVTSAQLAYNKPTLVDRNILIGEYKDIFKGADWLGGDWYVRNTGRSPDQIGSLTRKMINLMRAWSGGKPMLVFIECGLQGLNKTGAAAPTPAEMRANIWISLILGACGIIYFPAQVGGGFKFDVTPTDLVAEMVLQNQQIKQAEPWLLGGQRTMRVETDLEFGATWRLQDGTEMTADVQWNSAGNKWESVISIPDQTGTLKERLKLAESRLAAFDKWLAQVPKG